MAGLGFTALDLGIASRGASGPAIVLSATSIAEDAASSSTVGTLSVVNHPSGSSGWTFAETADPDNKFAVSGADLNTSAALNYEVATSHSVTITASKVGEDDLVRTWGISVSNVFEAANLAALGFSGTLYQNTSSTITITSATATSTLALATGSLPAGMTLNSGARTITGTPTTLGTGSAGISETLADSANSPRSNTWNWEVVEAPAETFVLLQLHADSRGVGTLLREAVDDTDTTDLGQFVREDPGMPGNVLGGYDLDLGLTGVIKPIQQAIALNGSGDEFLSPIEYAARRIRDDAGFKVDISGGGWNGAKVAGSGHILGALPDVVTAANKTKAGQLYAARGSASPAASLRPLIVTVDTTNDGATDPATLLAEKLQQLIDLRTATGFTTAPIVVVSTTPEHREDHGAEAVANLVEQANKYAALQTDNAFYCDLPRGYGDLHEGEDGTPGGNHPLVRDVGYDIYGRTCLIALGELAGATPNFTFPDNVDVDEESADEIDLTDVCDQAIYFTVDAGSTGLVELSDDMEFFQQRLRPVGGAWPAYTGTGADTRAYTLNYKTADGIESSITRHVVVNEVIPAAGFAFVASAVAKYSSGSSGCTTSAINTSGADLIVIAITGYTGGTATVTDSKGNTWTARTKYVDNATNASTRLYYCANPTVGSGHTFTLSGNDVYGRINVAAFSGGHASPYDTETGRDQPGAGGVGTSGAVTPSVNGSLLIATHASLSANVDFNTSPAFTELDNHTAVGGQSYSTGFAYYIQPTAGSINSGWSWTDSGGRTVLSLTAFKPA
jgi:hypothetical protein